MSEAVLADAQFSVARVFRPVEGFESIYGGQSSRQPINIPGGRDPDAGQTGFDPDLISGIPVPMGSKVMLWIPTIFQDNGGGDFQIVPYRYQLIWRLRNLRDFRERRGRSAYHFPRQSPGASNQFVVPAAQNIIIYEGPKQTRNNGPTGSQFSMTPEVYGTHDAVIERIEFPSATPLPPLVAAGVNGAYQQGVAALSGIEVNDTVTFNCVQFDAQGDELVIALDRLDDEGTTGPWNFSDPNGTDFGLSNFFGTGTGSIIRDLGIYVFTGSNP